jgi:glycosyltransferase involved in cell wall biosynthesis
VVHHIGIPTIGARVARPKRDGIVFVGRFVEKKGVYDLLDAVSMLPPRQRNTQVVLIGDGPERDGIASRASELGLNVRFTGVLSQLEIAQELQRAAVFCGPSRTATSGDAEGFGMVFIEAALNGVPVVAYAHGGVTSAVLDGLTGLLAPEGDVDGLSARLAELLDDEALRAKLSLAGSARVVSEFDVRTQTAMLESVYDRAVG